MKPFPNPPIREALLDIRTQLPDEVMLEGLSSFHEKIKEQFPKKEKRFSWEGSFQLKPGSAPEMIQPSGGPHGFFFKSEDEQKIVQARKDGFTFNQLRPYKNWDVFKPEAKKLWEHYVAIAKPTNVTRLALRYINCIEMPLPLKDFKEYVLTGPEIAKDIPQELANFFIQLVIPKGETGIVANITETMESINLEKKRLPFIFDIDVYKNVNLSAGNQKIWEIFDELRDYKNFIFTKSITKKCEILFQ